MTEERASLSLRARELFEAHHEAIVGRTDRMFAWLMLGQWLFGVTLAVLLSPYAWAGRTLWHQGKPTSAEKDLGLKCFDYAAPEPVPFGQTDAISSNLEKIPMLAARWSLDP